MHHSDPTAKSYDGDDGEDNNNEDDNDKNDSVIYSIS
jgi:hypothetical protein